VKPIVLPPVIHTNGVVTNQNTNLTARADGGPVSAGAPYLVGERGPELFVPAANGSIVPHGAGAVYVSAPITVNGPVLGSDAALQRAVEAAVLNGLRNAGVRLPRA
jgi:phage-related minor tail protein